MNITITINRLLNKIINMNILVLGATGMLGHKLIQILSENHEVFGTIRGTVTDYPYSSIIPSEKIIGSVSGTDIASIRRAIDEVKPDVVVNCIGIVKQLPEAQNPVLSITVNSLLPHQIAAYCKEKNCRFIHYSTDCVFTGEKGYYTEDDLEDAVDLYGRSKCLGEVGPDEGLTLRTSLIGRQLHGNYSLVEWFLSNQGGEVNGYTKAIFSGLTTNAHAHVLNEIITQHPTLSGLYHLAAEPINKYELLKMIRDEFDLDITIHQVDGEISNRSLDGSKLKKETGIRIPDWKTMIHEIAVDQTNYGGN